MKACHAVATANGGVGADQCQFSAAETAALVAEIVQRELGTVFDKDARVHTDTAGWPWEQDSDGCCGFALPFFFFFVFVFFIFFIFFFFFIFFSRFFLGSSFSFAPSPVVVETLELRV